MSAANIGEIPNVPTEDLWPDGEEMLLAAEWVDYMLEDGDGLSTDAVLAAEGIRMSLPNQRARHQIREEA